jgi:hypothetical protein
MRFRAQSQANIQLAGFVFSSYQFQTLLFRYVTPDLRTDPRADTMGFLSSSIHASLMARSVRVGCSEGAFR